MQIENQKVNLNEALKRYFGFNSFKGLQEDVVTSILNGKDTNCSSKIRRNQPTNSIFTHFFS